jgi:hypothetical protein
MASEPAAHIDREDTTYAPLENQDQPRIRRVVSESNGMRGAALRRHQAALSVVREDQYDSIGLHEDSESPAHAIPEWEEDDQATTDFAYDEEAAVPGRSYAGGQRVLPSYRTAPSALGSTSQERRGVFDDERSRLGAGARIVGRPSYRTRTAPSMVGGMRRGADMLMSDKGSPERAGASIGPRSTVPPSYRTAPSTFGSIHPPNRRVAQNRQEIVLSDDGSPERRNLGVGRGRSTAPPSYRTAPSNIGGIRQPR